MGKNEITKHEFPYLLGTLPYKTLVTGARYSNLPSTLRHSVSFSVTSDNIFYDPSPLMYSISLPAIAGKKITLSYAPATAADESTINAYIPKPNPDGTPIDPSRLPQSLPAYLINLKPELRIDGVVVATGGAMGMGQEEDFSIGLSSPTMSPLSIRNRVIAGEYNGIALDIAKISADQMTALKSKLETTKVKLENSDFTGITKDDIMGDLLYTTVLSYFAELDVMDFMSSKNMGIAATRLPSAGRFFMGLNTTTLFDVIISASAGGLTMDIGMIKNSSIALDGDYNKKIQFMMTSGTNSSALEHSVPEQLFSTPDNPAQGISAVKALQLANEQGIPIYTIDQTNISTVLPQLSIDGAAKVDIVNAVNAGKVVTVSKTNIAFNGWTGCGYIVVNPQTGAGAYMISGGLSGGCLFLLWASVFLLVCVLGSISLPLLIAAVIGGTLINFFGAQLININLGFQNSVNISSKSITTAVIGIIASVILGAGLLALAAVALPTAVFALAALIFYGVAGVFDFLLFWSKNQNMPLVKRSAYV